MTVSQLTYVVRKDDYIVVHDTEGGLVYDGLVRGTKKDDPVNTMFVLNVSARGGKIYIRATESKKKRGGRV